MRKLYAKVHYISAYRGIILILYNRLKYLILPSTNICTYLKTSMHTALMYCIHGNSHKPLVLLGVNLVVLLNELSGARLPARDLQGTRNCKTPSWNLYLSSSVHTHTGVHWGGGTEAFTPTQTPWKIYHVLSMLVLISIQTFCFYARPPNFWNLNIAHSRKTSKYSTVTHFHTTLQTPPVHLRHPHTTPYTQQHISHPNSTSQHTSHNTTPSHTPTPQKITSFLRAVDSAMRESF